MENNIDLYNLHSVITFMVNKYGLKNKSNTVPYDDLMQAGYVGYYRARSNFKTEYGKLSLSYVELFVRDEVLKLLRKEWRHINTVKSLSNYNKIYDEQGFIDSMFEVEGENCESLETLLINEETAKEETLDKVLKALPKLDSRKRDIISRTMLDGQPENLKALAKDYNISTQRVCDIRKKAIAELKEIINGQA